MAKTDVTQWDTTAANNTDINSVNIDEGCAPSGINNAIRELMAQVATALTNGNMINDGQVDADKLASNAVTTAKILAAAVTHAKLASGLHPVGMVSSYAGSAAPTGWILCYGQAISRTTYSELFTAIGTTYGVGDGSTTFNLPDLRGRVVAGQDDMGGASADRLTNQTGGVDGDTLGDAGGAETHALTGGEGPVHGHAVRISTTIGASSNATGGFMLDSAADANYSAYTGTPSSTAGEQIGGAGSGDAHNNVQPTLILNYIIFANA